MIEKEKLYIYIVGLLDFIISIYLFFYFGRPLIDFKRYPPYIDFFVMVYLFGSVILLCIGILIFWVGIVSIRQKINARIYNLRIYSFILYLSAPIGLLFAILSYKEPLFKRIIFVMPAILALIIVVFLTRPKVKELFK